MPDITLSRNPTPPLRTRIPIFSAHGVGNPEEQNKSGDSGLCSYLMFKLLSSPRRGCRLQQDRSLQPEAIPHWTLSVVSGGQNILFHSCPVPVGVDTVHDFYVMLLYSGDNKLLRPRGTMNEPP